MTQLTTPPRVEIIPANAPFSEAQRLWLNGFLVGMLGLDGATPLPRDQNNAVLGPAGDGDDGEAPWHDQTIGDCRSHEARRSPTVAATHDGGNGAAGLRPVRL